MARILWQTVSNFLENGATAAFSGPLVRGDSATVRSHLKALEQVPGAKQIYLALARNALASLPAKNREELKKIIG